MNQPRNFFELRVIDLFRAVVLRVIVRMETGDEPHGRHAALEEGPLIAAAQEVTGAAVPTRDCPRRPGDPPVLVAASEMIRSELGWTPNKPSVAEMVADAWAFAQAHPRGYSE